MIKLLSATIPFLFAFSFLSFSQDIDWVKHLREPNSTTFSAGKEQFVKKIIPTRDNGILICGHFEGSMDFDPGIQDTIFYATTLGNGFIIKLDSLGNFSWLKLVSGSLGSGIEDITEDDLGNIYYTGFVRGVGTIDTGGQGIIIGSGASYTSYVMAINSDGNYLWHQLFNNVSGAHNSTGFELLVVANKLFLTGNFSGTLDANPAGAPILLSESNGTNFLICLDTNSNYNWHHQAFNNVDDGRTLTADSLGNVYYSYIASNTYLKKFDLNGNVLLDINWGSGNSFVIEDVAIDQNGGIYITGYGEGGAFQYPIYDLDPGPGIFEVPAGTFYARFDPNGNFYNGKGIGGGMYNDQHHSKGTGIALDYLKNVYITGRNRTVGSNGNNRIFIFKYDTLGNAIWQYILDGQSDDYGNDIIVDRDLNVYTVGGFSCSVDFDPDPISYEYLSNSTLMCTDGYSEDGFILKWKQDSCDNLGIIIDTIIGTTCSTSGFVQAHAVNSSGPYLYSWDGGPFTSTPSFSPATGGNYLLTVRASNQCEKVREFHVPGPTALGTDVQVNSTVIGLFAPDFSGKIKIDAFNAGCTSSSSGQIFLVVPDNLIYDSASISPNFIQGDTLIWDYSNLDYQGQHLLIDIFYTGDTLIQSGDIICYPTWITPSVDNDPSNNEKIICRVAQTSYNPNEKFASPTGECLPNYIDTAQRLTYTVMFQNTGTQEAYNIYILDSISSHLDVSTLEIVATSHTVMTEILPGNVLKFRFDDINLPDSTSNLEESMGYVIFEISQKDSLLNNTVITNSAGIYIDYTSPVFTSEVLHTVVDLIPTETSSYLASTACDSLATHGSVFYSTGQYPILLNNVYGCDSTLLLDLTLKQSSNSFINATVCDEFVIGNTTYSNTGVYEHYLTNAEGCDSVVNLDLIVQNTSSTFYIDTCSALDINGITYSSSGVYTQVLPNTAGCDSIITYNLTISNPSNSMSISACDSIKVNGVSYSSSGSYLQTLTSALGCDSLLTLDIDMNYSTVVPLTEIACYDYTLNGITYDNSGNYHQYYTNSYGCDSVISLNLTIYEDSEVNLFLEGIDSIEVNGINYYTSGTYTQSLTSSVGCDSTLNLFLSIGYTELNSLQDAINIFPNPTATSVFITGKIHGIHFQMMDGLGRIQNVPIRHNFDRVEVDLSSLSSGVYYIVSDVYPPQPIIKH